MKIDNLRVRIVMLTIMSCGMVFYWLWEAQLISYFSFPSKSLPFHNLEEFLTETDKKVFISEKNIDE